MLNLQTSRRHRMIFSIACVMSTVACCTPLSRAALVTTDYNVTLDTASLVTDSTDQPFALFLSLISGGSAGVSNTVMFSNFTFDTGASGDASTIVTSGDATGSLSGMVTLDTDVSSSFNSFQQDFVPGANLNFHLSTTENEVDPNSATPDELAVAIFDQTGTPLPTTDPSGADSLITVTYEKPSTDFDTYGSDASRTTTGGQTLVFAAPVLTAVPEPSTGVTMITALVISCGIWKPCSCRVM